MGAPMCGGCGKARALIRPNVIRNPNSLAARRGRVIAMRDHGLCRRCWRAILEPMLVEQHMVREASRVA